MLISLLTCLWEYLSWFEEQSSQEGKGQLQQINIQSDKPKKKDCPPGLNGGKGCGCAVPSQRLLAAGGVPRMSWQVTEMCRGQLAGLPLWQDPQPQGLASAESRESTAPGVGCWDPHPLPGKRAPHHRSFLDSSTRSCPQLGDLGEKSVNFGVSALAVPCWCGS